MNFERGATELVIYFAVQSINPAAQPSHRGNTENPKYRN